MRPVISWSLAVCLGVAAAPWLSGGQEPVAGLISAFALLLGTVLLSRQPSVRQLKRGPLVWIYGALMGWAALSLIWSVNRYSSEVWLVQLGLAGVAFRLAVALADEVAGRLRLLWVFLGSAAVFAGYGLYLYVSGGYDRLTGPFYWPNPAAAYLLVGWWLAYDGWRRRREAWWLGALSVLFGASFVLTESRAAAAVGVFVLLIYILCIKLNKRFWITFVFTLVASVGVAYGCIWLRHELQPKAVVTTPGSRLTPAGAGNLQSGADRITYLESVVSIWVKHPILGTGAGTFPDVHPQYQQRVVSASSSAHNVYAQTLAELGLVGLMLLLGLGATLLVGMLRGLMQRPLGLAAMMGAGVLWLHFGLDIDAQYPALVLLLAGFSGALYYQKPAYGKLGWRLPLMAGLVIVPVMAFYISDVWTIRGNAAQSDSDYDLAASDFSRAHAYWFYNPDVLTAEGINRFTLAQIGTAGADRVALGLARAAERQDRVDGQHYQLEGFVLKFDKQPVAAMAAFRHALVLDPYNHPEYAYNLALMQAQTGDAAGALKTANAMLAQYPPLVVANRAADPSVRDHLAQLAVLVGTIHLQAGDMPAAEAASKQALAFDASNVRAQAFASVLQRASATPTPAPTPTTATAP